MRGSEFGLGTKARAGDVASQAPAPGATSVKHLARVQAVIDFIESHLREPLPMEQLARQGGLSVWYFQRIFRGVTGETVADYVRLHKTVTGMNGRSVWEILSESKSIDEFKNTPEHFQKWLAAWIERLNFEYGSIRGDADLIFRDRPIFTGGAGTPDYHRRYRAECARFFQREVREDTRLLPVLFAMLDGKDIDLVIWKLIKPRGDDQSFRTEGE